MSVSISKDYPLAYARIINIGSNVTTPISNDINSSLDTVNNTYEDISDLLDYNDLADILFTEYSPGDLLNFTSGTDQTLATANDIDTDEPYFLGEYPDLPTIDIDIGTIPEPSFSRPDINIPELPVIDWPTFNEDPPAAHTINIPAAPTISLPDPPDLDEITIPGPPQIDVPEFEGTAPTINLTPPDINPEWNETEYTSNLRDLILTQLQSDLQSGGDGFSATIEQQLYDRELSRRQMKEEQEYLLLLQQIEKKGWMLPPGQLVGDIVDISDKISDSREELSNEIMCRQAEMAQENSHFAMEKAIEIDIVLHKHHNRMQQRSYEMARFGLDAALKLYGLRIESYKAQILAYQSAAQLYDARIRAEIVKAQIYRVQIEGAKVTMAANTVQINLYKSQLKSINALIEMYKAEMESGRILAEIERTQIVGYAARIDAYQARVEAVIAEYDGYIAQVRGQTALADLVKADAEAYKTRTKAYRTQAELELEEARATIERLQVQLRIYAADVQRYSISTDYLIGTAKSRAQLANAYGELNVIQARYNAASRDVDAKNYSAHTIITNGRMRASAIMQNAMSDAQTTTARAQAEATRAAEDAAATVSIATASVATTNISTSVREVASQNNSSTISRNTTMSGNLTNTLTLNDYYIERG